MYKAIWQLAGWGVMAGWVGLLPRQKQVSSGQRRVTQCVFW
jgi:hypothetical protein